MYNASTIFCLTKTKVFLPSLKMHVKVSIDSAAHFLLYGSVMVVQSHSCQEASLCGHVQEMDC